MIDSFLRKRWYDFRAGHGVYLIFLMSFANFILIFHRLLIERVEWLNVLLGNIILFTTVFVLVYVPVAILVGVWHRRTQIKIDADIGWLYSPINAKVFRILLDAQMGKASAAELEKLRALLKDIEDKGEN